MNGVNIATGCHPLIVLNPQTISGGATGQCFNMKGAEHASIGIIFGAEGGSPPTLPTSIVLNQCSNVSGANATAIASFRYYYQTTAGAGNDILNGVQQALTNSPSLPPNWTTSTAGITALPAGLGGIQIWIEIDSAELETAAVDVVGPINELPYLQVVINNGAYTTYACVIAILSGLRYAYNVGASATT